MKMVRLSEHFLNARRQFCEVFRFLSTTPPGFTATATSGTVAVVDQRGGGLSLLTQAADDALGFLISNSKLCVLAADKPFTFSADVRFAEANTSAANIFVGLSSTTATATLQTAGAGPAANYSGFGFFKTDGGSANWSVEASNGTSQVTAELNAVNSLTKTACVAASGSTHQSLKVEVYPKTTTLADVVFLIDDVAVYKLTDWVFTSIAAMGLLAVVRAGSSSAETLVVRQMEFAQVL